MNGLSKFLKKNNFNENNLLIRIDKNSDIQDDLENKNLKKDWHNYNQIAYEMQRKGPGEQGLGFGLDPIDAKSNLKQVLYSQNGFNALVSDKISLKRSLSDIRHSE